MGKEMEPNYGATLELKGVDGEVKIADDVIAAIAGMAATEIEGVAYMSGNITKEIIGKLGIKNLSRGVVIRLEEGKVHAELSIVIRYGYSIPKTSRTIQEKVKSSIEGMTGLPVERVNVHIIGVDIDKA
ncbi:MAG: Asp23/Gls24 family envelope stress response protein [Lachnospiraceae bacterium]|nr:Asp23/Gls24 family envelope stress response protein [Lachnospiraceae bacterium]